jgi:hypothetical protein
MTERTVGISQQSWARVAGLALLAIIIFGLAGTLVQNVDDAAALQDHFANERRYRIGLALEFLMLNSDILLAVALYGLLRPIDGPLALLGTLWRFANALVLGVGVVAALTAWNLAASPQDFASLRPDQVPDVAVQFLRMHGAASLIGLAFWSMGAAVHSYLLWVSKYIPRVLSGSYFVVAAMILLCCFVCMISPSVEAVIDPWFVFPDIPVELAVALWLSIKGARIRIS